MTTSRHFEFSCVIHGVFLTMHVKPETPPICPHCEQKRLNELLSRILKALEDR